MAMRFLLTGLCLVAFTGRADTVSAIADADTFVRSMAPTNNYGAGGALSVSGSSSLNGNNVQNGLFDSVIRFPMSNVVASFDTAFGSHDWIVTDARLVVTEMAAPDNAIFNRGVGQFEIRWLAGDSWMEGTGKPMMPTTDGLSWQDLATLLNPGVDQTLGIFTNAGVDGQLAFVLGRPDNFVADAHSGNEVTLYLTAASPSVGFTFDSRNFGNTNAQPRLEITAMPNPVPAISSIVRSGTNIVLHFAATTNWSYRLQRSTQLAAPHAWTDVLILPPLPAATNVAYTDSLTNSAAFYRLSVSQ